MNINNNKLKDVSDLESFNAKLKPIYRLQMVFSTETHVSMLIYLHITKFNLVKKGLYAKMAQWFERSGPSQSPGFNSSREFILFLFCFVLSELDIIKVINCFFFLLKSLTF